MWKNTDYPQGIARSKVLLRNEALARLARGRTAAVSEKIREIVQQPPQTYQRLPFLKEAGELPLGVVRSVLDRKAAIWGRF